MNAIQKQRLQRFVDQARDSAEHLAFILDNLGALATMNYDAASLEHVQTVYNRIKGTKDPIAAEWRDNMMHVVPLYLGEMIIHATDGEWVPETRKSFLHQGPYRVTGFGDMERETYYPAMARQMIVDDSAKMTSTFTDAMGVWSLRCTILDGVADCLAASSNPQTISDIMNFLETVKIAPQARFGAGRYNQFQKRVLILLKRDPRFRSLPKTQDTFQIEP